MNLMFEYNQTCKQRPMTVTIYSTYQNIYVQLKDLMVNADNLS